MPGSTLTLNLPAEVITQGKILAAQRKVSLSGLFTVCNKDLASRDEAYRTESCLL